MIEFSLLVIWILLAKPIAKKLNPNNAAKTYCILVFLATVFLQGCRSIYIGGVDTASVYVPSFERIVVYNMEQVFERHGAKDFLFYFLTKLFTYISNNVHLYIFLISMFVMMSYCRFVYKYSKMPVLSFICYFALGYYAAGFQQLRHVVALSVLLFAYSALQDRKLINFCFIVLLASMFHSTAIIFLVAYPLAHMKVGLKQWGVMILVLMLCFFAKGTLQKILSVLFSESERYGKYVEANYSVQLSVFGILILLCFYFVSFFLAGRNIKMKSENQILFNMSALSICFMSLIVIIGEFQRISMFFGIYNTLLLPSVLKEYRSRRQEKLLIIMGIAVVLIMYFLLIRLENSRLLDYRFFWQD